MLKIPETVRIPVIGGYLYKYLIKKENAIIENMQVVECGVNCDKRDIIVTVSLTSFPARINQVYIAIKSLLLQSYKPDRIILWLANEQFPDHVLPDNLTELEKYGLEIKWCDDLYGHKKYYYCIHEQKPNEVIITYDDDIIYPVDSVKRLVETYRKFPTCLICERAQSVIYKKNGEIENPGRWQTLSDVGVKEPSYSLNPSPGGGCLIPYKAFYDDAYNEEKIRQYAYKNDDLWYMFMAAQNGTKTVKTKKYHKPFTIIQGTQEYQMATENVLGDRNIQIFKNLAEVYPVAYKRIVNDK